MGKAPCCDKANVKKGPWSPEEDAKLKAYVERHGTGGNWIALPHKIGLKRCGKSCRLRWLNYLRPNIRHGGFSEEEDNLISSLYISIGSRWSIIAAQLPGRTDNDIKNYWNTKLKKKLLGRCKESQASGSPSSSQESMVSQNYEGLPRGLSASAHERMQLHVQLHGLQGSLSLLNEPALWHKFQNLGNRVLSIQHDSTNADESVQRLTETSSTRESLPTRPEFDELSSFVVENTLGGIETSSLNGACSPSRSMTFNMELVSFRETDGGRESEIWWAGNGIDEQLSTSSWDSTSAMKPETMFQEYLLGYDL
ncbi:unnamed protein product [Spirodela intermedia]|uniref:Uncharacterized protein n=1 Tax=Spirodela intermedia TaxID=51605 RepID=A0A7I8LCH7_SPIIN|nr:unnamed protein product [Spirodela intermedia]